jgi:hypothetical protein
MPATMKEKLQTLLADQRQRNAQRNKDATTFSQFGASEAREIEGRHAKPATVVGTTETPGMIYGWGPNWSHDPVPQEPPLGVHVHAHEPVGEFFEIEKSLEGDAQQTGANLAGASSAGASSSSPNEDLPLLPSFVQNTTSFRPTSLLQPGFERPRHACPRRLRPWPWPHCIFM